MINIDDRILGEVDESQLFLLCAIAKHMGNNSKAWPSNETLCKTTRWSESKLLRVKKSAIEAGLLGAESRYINNAQTSNLYHIKTRRIGVMVNLADIPPTSIIEAPPPSKMNTPPLQKWRAEVLTNEVLTNLTTTKEKIDVAVFDPEVNALIVESFDLKAEIKIPPIPLTPPRFVAFEIDAAATELKNDPLAQERYIRDSGILSYSVRTNIDLNEAYSIAINNFVTQQKSTGFNYNNRIDFRKHFFNWVNRKRAIDRTESNKEQPKSILPKFLQNR